MYEIQDYNNQLLKQILQSRFIEEGVYGFEKYSISDYKEEYLFTPSFDKREGECLQKDWNFQNEDVKEINLYELVLTKPLFMPLDTNAFLDLFNLMDNVPNASVFTQVLFCKRQDNWRETAISQYESFLKGNDRPLEGKFSIKWQERILGVLTKLNNYTIKRDQVEEMEQKILQTNYRFECRFVMFEQKYAKQFVAFLENALVKLQLFNEFTIKKVSNKRSFLKHIENRQFQVDLANQILSESELYSVLCDKTAASAVQKVLLEQPTKHTSVSKTLGESIVIQKASSFMPYSTNKVDEIDETKITAINNAFRRVGIVDKPLEVTDVYQGASLLKVQMEVPPEITYTSITKKLVDVQGAMGNKNITIEIGELPDTVNIFIPLDERTPVYFNDVLESEEFNQFKEENLLPFIIGENVNGGYIFACLTKLRHLLVSGTTGSGKSVFLNLIILCFILSIPPEQLMLYLIDPKMVEFSQFKDFPQVKSVITDMRKANAILMALVAEMESRYELFSQTGSRDIQGYNLKSEEKLPYIVFVIDELADLMMVNKSVETDIIRLCQKARGAGIHLILATQRPSVDVVTGLIKANMPSRVTFAVTSATDSRTILDRNGAEKLLGRGDGFAKIEGGKNEFERFQAPVLTLDKKEEEGIFDKLIHLFDGVVVEGELEEIKEEEPIDQLKRWIANTGEVRVNELARLIGLGNNKVHAMMVELVNEGFLKKEGRSYAINVDEEELEKWRDKE
ncbi:FtsK/SpoIIIE domain-containing protein [Bacillus sp. ISL-46]|uniref:FtsK/SpoIIIE domain-containing protein n=1 Tax=Bacillus sp. ISL-46 TaxID=2819129 RepID=UPI001BEB43E6|nr:FtsK/SpoIIIE domain-containing protein [Bacillus sp. ISL-46]MBT2724850.1 DNA translocase FtsK [Bacillus sp. ISL-46]